MRTLALRSSLYALGSWLLALCPLIEPTSDSSSTAIARFAYESLSCACPYGLSILGQLKCCIRGVAKYNISTAKNHYI